MTHKTVCRAPVGAAILPVCSVPRPKTELQEEEDEGEGKGQAEGLRWARGQAEVRGCTRRPCTRTPAQHLQAR